MTMEEERFLVQLKINKTKNKKSSSEKNQLKYLKYGFPIMEKMI